MERPQRPGANRGGQRLQGGDEVAEKPGGVVLPRVQRQPGGRAGALGEPVAEQGGFAEAGGGREEGELAGQAGVQPFEQVGAPDPVRPRGRAIQFGGEQGRRHSASIWDAPAAAQKAPDGSARRGALLRRARQAPHLRTVSQQTSRGSLTPRMANGSSGRAVRSR